jgi:hypothetical protein
VARRPAFGWGNAFDVTTAGRASLSYATPVTRPLLVILQAVVWLAAIVLAIGGRRRHRREDEPLPAGGAALIDLGATGAHPLPWDDQIGADADWADGWPVPDAGDRSPGPDIGRDEEVGAGALDSRALQAALAPHPPSADDRADGPSDWREVAP